MKENPKTVDRAQGEKLKKFAESMPTLRNTMEHPDPQQRELFDAGWLIAASTERDKVAADLERVLGTYNEARKFLLEFNYKTAELMQEFPFDKSRAVEDMQLQLEDALAIINLPKETLHTLLFFLTRKSKFFSAMSARYRDEMKTPEFKADGVVKLVDRTVDFLNSLLDDQKLKLSDLIQVDDLQTRMGKDYHAELKIVAEFFEKHLQLKGSDLRGLEAGFQLVQFRRCRDNIIDFLTTSEIYPEAVKAIDRQSIPIDDNSTLAQAKKWIEQLKALFGGMLPYVEVYTQLSKSRELIQFLASVFDTFNTGNTQDVHKPFFLS